ncbi:MAG: hypothetical protein QG604_907 [Candidatus Dependentiae bacterium]|nr:hypothetical protein [Candidatus Dependentiae bacterium]
MKLLKLLMGIGLFLVSGLVVAADAGETIMVPATWPHCAEPLSAMSGYALIGSYDDISGVLRGSMQAYGKRALETELYARWQQLDKRAQGKVRYFMAYMRAKAKAQLLGDDQISAEMMPRFNRWILMHCLGLAVWRKPPIATSTFLVGAIWAHEVALARENDAISFGAFRWLSQQWKAFSNEFFSFDKTYSEASAASWVWRRDSEDLVRSILMRDFTPRLAMNGTLQSARLSGIARAVEQGWLFKDQITVQPSMKKFDLYALFQQTLSKLSQQDIRNRLVCLSRFFRQLMSRGIKKIKKEEKRTKKQLTGNIIEVIAEDPRINPEPSAPQKEKNAEDQWPIVGSSPTQFSRSKAGKFCGDWMGQYNTAAAVSWDAVTVQLENLWSTIGAEKQELIMALLDEHCVAIIDDQLFTEEQLPYVMTWLVSLYTVVLADDVSSADLEVYIAFITGQMICAAEQGWVSVNGSAWMRDLLEQVCVSFQEIDRQK